MNRNLHATDVLTEFAPIEDDDNSENIISRFVTRITSAVNTTPTTPVEESAAASSVEVTPPSPSVPAPEDEESTKRTPLSVIKRISNMVAQKDSGLHHYKDSELQKFWMPDSKSKECYDCSMKFTTFRRRHHCRLCGQIFCSKCCNQVVPGKIIKVSGDLKVCTYCSKVVLSYLKSSDIAADLQTDLRALQDDLINKLSPSEDISAAQRKMQRKVSVGYQEERLISSPNLTQADRRSILQQSNSLKMLAEEMSSSLSETVNGQDLVGFMMSTHKSADEEQASVILNALIDAGFLIPIDFPQTEEADGPIKVEFDEIYTYRLLKVTMETEALPTPSPDRSHVVKDFDHQESFLSTVAAKPLLESFCDHEEQLIHQLLSRENIDEVWAKILITICARVANTIRPETCNVESMDIRNFVNFKKVPGDARTDSKIVGGVVFSKNVTHKDMPTHIEKPRVLLLQCAILFQRVEGRFVSLENLLLQEHEYLRNVTARILSFGANIVLVHKSVAGIAQEMLKEKGITLVLDVKLPILERLARCLQCDIVTSIDSNIKRPKLGICDAFYRKTFDVPTGGSKTLMFFETRYNPRGCCILLRGAPHHELNKIKKIASTMLFARYNWLHEMAFLLDEFACPPPSKAFETPTPQQSPEKEIHEAAPKKTEKIEVQKMSINLENVQDGEDPLRSETSDDTSTPLQLKVVAKSYDNKFRTALSTTILSVSPNVSFPLPYLETEQGQKCALRSRFPEELFYSKQWSTTPVRETIVELVESPDKVNLIEAHDYVTHQIVHPFDHKEEQNMLANFRMRGGRLPKQLKMKILPRKSVPNVAHHTQRSIEEYVYKDALDLDNHQRLPVLFYSYYSNPKTTSSFCVLPFMLEMTFYGQNDIMLGLFLERYCFRGSYICQFCNLPMTDHVRRYVHSMGCVQVKLHEDSKRPNETSKGIMMSSVCGICGNVWSPTVPMSKDSWCLSLAKYLELRFHGHSYRRNYVEQEVIEEEAKCQHSIHRDYVQVFSCNGLVARISYEPIEIWEILLPHMSLRLKHLKEFEKTQVLEDIKSFAMRGYEVFAHIHDQIADISPEVENPKLTSLKVLLNNDQLGFKQRVETVQTLLTETPLNVYEINDAMLMVKRTLCESIEVWGPRLHEAALHAKAALSASSKPEPIIDNATICTEDLRSNPSSPDSVVVSESDVESEKTVEEDQEDEASFRQKLNSTDSKDQGADKNPVKQFLSHFMGPSGSATTIHSPVPGCEHHTLPLGLFPILVHDQDLSSIVAYSLISSDYKRALSAGATLDSRTDQSESEMSGNQEDPKEKVKRNHVVVTFQDSTTTFSCKIYFAREFDTLRRNFLVSPFSSSATDSSPLQRQESEDTEEVRKAFARSLCRSVKWEARGGKSGSKFSKTIDDQFVLKEMSKTDVAIFENFAPNYFEYISQCQTQRKPTLLAKIFGVFKVTVKKKDSLVEKAILVMEHLFANRNISNKFDLKGSERNRLVDPTNQTGGEIVLLDENLMQSKSISIIYSVKSF